MIRITADSVRSADLVGLADGLNQQLQGLAQNLGAPSSSLEWLRRAIEAIVGAAGQGQTCASIDDIAKPDDRALAQRALLASRIVATPDSATALPLLLDEAGRLYTYRYFDYERRVARAVARLARQAVSHDIGDRTRRNLDSLFARNVRSLPANETDWQKVAAALAVLNRLTVISGGPGTGKTTTLVAILVCLLDVDPKLRVALAAPTGKAAARMLAAVQEASDAVPARLLARLPQEAFTLHRLLGARPGYVRLRHDERNPLAYDVLVVDEASMLDVALAAKLMEAIPATGRLILLGDRNQLAAVEAGSVFGELAANPFLSRERIATLGRAISAAPDSISPFGGSTDAPLGDTTVWLSRSFRFSSASAIGRFAGAVRDEGHSLAAMAALEQGRDELRLFELAAGPLSAQAIDDMLDGYAEFVGLLQARSLDPALTLRAFDRHRVLCALRVGPRGTAAINGALSRALCRRIGFALPRSNPWFPGRPVIVTENDYGLKLYNGDVGVGLPDERGGCQVWFADAERGVRALPASRLPAHETALAMTVHKAQGSEFDTVTVVLPDAQTPVLTRELLYTATTRARSRVSVLGARDLVQWALGNPARRAGGLSARLREAYSAGRGF